MERPNTVAGLIEKRRELTARLKLAKSEIKSLTAGIDALDQVLKLFAPEINGADAKEMRLPIAHAANKGEMQRAALDLLRETSEAVTSRMVASRFCDTRNLRLDEAAFKSVRYRASNAMCHLRDKGLVRQVGKKGADVRWVLAESQDSD